VAAAAATLDTPASAPPQPIMMKGKLGKEVATVLTEIYLWHACSCCEIV
jgi:hypothetical protein